MDPSHCADSFSETLKSLQASEKKTILLRYDVAYAHKAGMNGRSLVAYSCILSNPADEVITQLRQRLPLSRILHTPISLIAHPAAERQQGSSPHLNNTSNTQSTSPSEDTRQEGSSPEDSVILYIGGECLTLTNLLLTHASYEVCSMHFAQDASLKRLVQVFSYNPATRETRLESGRTNKLLMRRYGAVQKARDADVIGILVGTLGVGQSCFRAHPNSFADIDVRP